MSESLTFFYGSLLSASWVNLVLYILELTLAYRYFSLFWEGRKLFFWMVAALLVADTFSTMAICASTWLKMVTYAGSPPLHCVWSFHVAAILTTISGVIEQCFLIYRFFSLSKNKVITVSLVIIMLAHATFSFMWDISTVLNPEPGKGYFTSLVSACLSSAISIIIPVALIWQLRKIRASLQSSHSLFRQVSVNAVSSGGIVALLGILYLVLFWVQSGVFVVVGSCIGRVYGITVLVNLSVRQRRRSLQDSTALTTRDLSMSLRLDSRSFNANRPESTVLRVHQVATHIAKGTTPIIGDLSPAFPSCPRASTLTARSPSPPQREERGTLETKVIDLQGPERPFSICAASSPASPAAYIGSAVGMS